MMPPDELSVDGLGLKTFLFLKLEMRFRRAGSNVLICRFRQAKLIKVHYMRHLHVSGEI